MTIDAWAPEADSPESLIARTQEFSKAESPEKVLQKLAGLAARDQIQQVVYWRVRSLPRPGPFEVPPGRRVWRCPIGAT